MNKYITFHYDILIYFYQIIYYKDCRNNIKDIKSGGFNLVSYKPSNQKLIIALQLGSCQLEDYH